MAYTSIMDLPPVFLTRINALLGAQSAAFLAACDQPAVAGLRVNGLKLTPAAFQVFSPFPLTPVPWCQSGFTIATAPTPAPPGSPGSNDLARPYPSPGKHPYHAAGLYYLQEPAAMLAAELLAPQPGERVLDIAAAPGGKASHIAALMGNTGLFVANEIHPRRVWDLAENLERCGLRNAAITNAAPEQLASHFGPFFDRVLLDAPCSGEGMFRKSPAARADWSPQLVLGCAARQSVILAAAARLVRPGGRLVYSTCTFAPEENEGAVTRFLGSHPDFEIITAERRSEFSPGLPGWEGAVFAPEIERAIRLWPHRAACEGHFLVGFQRRGSPSETVLPARPPARVPGPIRQAFYDFSQTTLADPLLGLNLALEGSYLYHLPPGLPDLDGLKVIHPGWWLGTLKSSSTRRTSRFEPAHALALGLAAPQVRQVMELAVGRDDRQILAYLRGESLPNSGPDGWVLVAIAGCALGWGKRSQGILKNGYPKGLRW